MNVPTPPSPSISDRLPLSANLRGALCFIFGTAFLVTNDTLVKLQSAEMPIGQLIFVRSWFAVAFTLLACWWLGVLHHLKDLTNRAVMARAGVNAGPGVDKRTETHHHGPALCGWR